MERQGKDLIGTCSPWGCIDHADLIIEGITNVSTPSHGGVKVSRELNERIPIECRDVSGWHTGGWYEEDCDWAIPYIVFEEEILAQSKNPHTIDIIKKGYHKDSLKRWHPELVNLLLA